MNINGKWIGCITKLSDLKHPVELRPLPGMPVFGILLLICPASSNITAVFICLMIMNLQRKKDFRILRKEINLMDYMNAFLGCCSTSCPSFWWNPEKFIGPGIVTSLQVSSRLTRSKYGEKIDDLEDPYKLFDVKYHELC